MHHEEYLRIVPDAKTAVLLIHGICGTPNHFRAVLPLEELVPEGWSLHNLVLDGHCATVEDFAHSSMEKWKSQVRSAFEALARTHDQVILVAHSMGTLLSVELSLEYSEKIPVLFLINVPLRVMLRPFGVRNILRLAFGRLDFSDPIQKSTAQTTGIQMTKKLWKFIPWVPRILELLREMRRTIKRLDQIPSRCIAFQSEKDELVSNRSRRLLEKSGRVEVYNLLHSTHFYYSPEDTAAVHAAFGKICEPYQ